MAQKYSREELVARMVRAGELEVSGEHQDELTDFFGAEYSFHGPGGLESDYGGLAAYFQSLRDAFEDRSIRRGIILVEGNTIACQTWIEGTFAQEFTQSPEGPIPPNGRRIVFDLINIFQMDDDGRFVEDFVRADNRSLLEALRAPAYAEAQN
jgi:predicted ester cyclase